MTLGYVYAAAILFLAGNAYLYSWFYRVLNAGLRDSDEGGSGRGYVQSTHSTHRSSEGSRSRVGEPARVHYTVRPMSTTTSVHCDGQSIYGHLHYGQRPLTPPHHCKYPSNSWHGDEEDDGCGNGAGEEMAMASESDYHGMPHVDSVL